MVTIVMNQIGEKATCTTSQINVSHHE